MMQHEQTVLLVSRLRFSLVKLRFVTLLHLFEDDAEVSGKKREGKKYGPG
jgi:hypothetical protein